MHPKNMSGNPDHSESVALPSLFRKTNLAISLLVAISDHLFCIGFSAIGCWALMHLPMPLAILVNVIAIQRIAFHLRGLECMVHEASHYNWTRHKLFNDFLGNLIAACPVFSRVEEFRRLHRQHHRLELFGTRGDPDFVRGDELLIHLINWESMWDYFRHQASVMPKYIGGWWKAIGTRPLAFASGVVWHGVLLFILATCLGPAKALSYWAAYFLFPFTVILPIQRYMAEVAKHPYGHVNAKVGWVGTTVSNIGWVHRWMLHPHHDGYHTVHHVSQCVPHHRLKAAHEWLRENDSGYTREVIVRHYVFEDIRRILQCRKP